MLYGERSNGKQHGLVLTKPEVVEFMLDRVKYTADRNLDGIKVLEPASGDGAFAKAIIKRLYNSSQHFNFSFQKSLINLKFFEIDERMAEKLGIGIDTILGAYGVLRPEGLVVSKDYLSSDQETYDLVIGNPPYVRHENIPEDQKSYYRERFGTFTHRSDLYIAFYEKGLSSLTNNGILSFLCSNRWLKNQYGKKLRELISLKFSVEEIIDLEKTNPFEEDVIAYPAITTIVNERGKGVENFFEMESLSDFNEIGKKIKPSRQLNFSSGHWFSYNYTGEDHEKNLDSIENQGFKIGIGVATGSDKVFISEDFKSIIEEEVLLPILTSRDIRNNTLEWSGKYILNPFDSEGGLIDLEKYPMAKKYLYSKRKVLEKRHISKKNPAKWYKTIDRIKPELTGESKIILPDISGNTHLLIDEGNYYPHHNLYYITGRTKKKLVLLAAILMSDFVKDQLIELGNKMNGGYPRWQSQNLKKLRIPNIDSIPVGTSDSIIAAYHSRDYKLINELVNPETISKYHITTGQTRLFEPEVRYKAELKVREVG